MAKPFLYLFAVLLPLNISCRSAVLNYISFRGKQDACFFTLLSHRHNKQLQRRTAKR